MIIISITCLKSNNQGGVGDATGEIDNRFSSCGQGEDFFGKPLELKHVFLSPSNPCPFLYYVDFI